MIICIPVNAYIIFSCLYDPFWVKNDKGTGIHIMIIHYNCTIGSFLFLLISPGAPSLEAFYAHVISAPSLHKARTDALIGDSWLPLFTIVALYHPLISLLPSSPSHSVVRVTNGYAFFCPLTFLMRSVSAFHTSSSHVLLRVTLSVV